MSTTTQEPETVMNLMADFERLPGCEEYKADSQKIEMVTTYLWLRQLTDGLTFERFLEKYAAIADFNEENRKHPSDAIRHFCPRAKKQADDRQVPQWTAAEVVDIMALYVDIVRECERTNVEVPLTLAQYLETEGPAYKRGEIPPPPPARRRNATPRAGGRRAGGNSNETATEQAATAAATGVISNPSQPTAGNQRIIYSPPAWQGRQLKGTTTNVTPLEGGLVTADFVTDEGEKYVGVVAEHCAVIHEQIPAIPTPTERKVLTIPTAQFPLIQQALMMGAPMGNVPVGNSIYTFTVSLDCGLSVDVTVLNGETGPYVDSQLISAGDAVVGEIPPRKNILGEYRYETTTNGLLVVEVRTRG